MRRQVRVALVTCAELPDLDEDTQLLAQALRARGIDAGPAIWSDPQVDWNAFDLAVVRTSWDYAPRRDEFVAWAERVPRLLNSAAALRWNTDKTYLRELAARGVRIVPTQWLDPKRGQSPLSGQSTVSAWEAPHAGEYVVKPAISASAADTSRYALGNPGQRAAATAHAQRLLDAQRAVMIQPYQISIDADGERSMIFLAGEYSHTVRKDAVLSGPREQEDLRFIPGGGSGLRSHEPTQAEIALARSALEAVPVALGELLYARVDLVPGENGAPLLMELEITEPELFLRMEPSAPARLAAGIEARLSRRSA